ncbi:uncharacterized protein LOC104266689 [Ciona intestinalis]
MIVMSGADDASTLFVGNLHDKVTEAILYELFLQAGPIKKVHIPVDHKNGRNRPYGFVTFRHEVSVPYSIKLMDGIQVFEYSLKVDKRKASGGSGNDTNGDSRPGHSSPRNNSNREVYNGAGHSGNMTHQPIINHNPRMLAQYNPLMMDQGFRDANRRESYETHTRHERGRWEHDHYQGYNTPREPLLRRMEDRTSGRYSPYEQNDVRNVTLRSEHRRDSYERRQGQYKRRR